MGERDFEIGERLRFVDGRGDWVISCLDHRCLELTRDRDRRTACTIGEAFEKADRIAPAPKPGQRWRKSGTVDALIVDCGYYIAVEPDNHNNLEAVWVHGFVVDVARWLLDNGYTHVAESAQVEIREGMRICRHMSDGSCTLGSLLSYSGNTWLWQSGDGCTLGPWSSVSVAILIKHGNWTIIDPGPSIREVTTAAPAGPTGDISQLRPLFDLVASIYTTPDRETSRRYVDMAVRQLRGEPFAKAIQAVLVAACDGGCLSPNQITALVAACRAWESARGRVAPGIRILSNLEILSCERAAHEAEVIAVHGSKLSWTRVHWHDRRAYVLEFNKAAWSTERRNDYGQLRGMGIVYERARSAC